MIHITKIRKDIGVLTFETFKILFAEVDLQHSAICIACVYLMLLMQFLENKVAVDLTRAEFVEAQQVGCQLHVCMKKEFVLQLFFWLQVS